MKRRRGRKSLYEVMGETRSKPRYSRILELLRPKKSAEEKSPAAAPAKPAIQMTERPMQWPKRPKILQLNAGRIELSMSYQLAIAILLGLILLLLVAFRLGQIMYTSSQNEANSAEKTPQRLQQTTLEATTGLLHTPALAEVKAVTPAPASVEEPKPAESKGDNRIVIQTYGLRAHLEPVKQFLADNGVESEIQKIGGVYYLVTTKKYENPGKQGTDGYFARQKIVELGAKYKAPQGYETFGAKPFHDAYGMKFDD